MVTCDDILRCELEQVLDFFREGEKDPEGTRTDKWERACVSFSSECMHGGDFLISEARESRGERERGLKDWTVKSHSRPMRIALLCFTLRSLRLFGLAFFYKGRATNVCLQ